MTSPLNDRQKQLLFDYCLGLTPEEQIAEAKQLISSNPEAAEIYSKLKAAFAPLDSIEAESCPDDLAEQTVRRLTNLARSSQLQLQQLLADEQSRPVSTIKIGFWRNLGEMVAVAAVIMFVAGVLMPSLNLARQKSWQNRCQMQLSQISSGMNHYISDHDGRVPAVASTVGAPWWKVGYQGKENHSNTRHVWLLAKDGYVDPINFVCPGKRQGRAIQFDPSQAENYSDFPARRYITYSLRIRCNKPSGNKPSKGHKPYRKVLMSDLNPLFERLPRNYSKPFKIRLNKDLLSLNSINHNRLGQNILFGDSSVKFVKTRHIGIAEDDIFTLKDTQIYEGYEVPSCETDAFLAP